MAILSKKEKLKLVRRYIGGQYVPTPDAFRSRTSFKASLLNWVKRYRLCGEKGLERKKRKRTSEADKRQPQDVACRANGTRTSRRNTASPAERCPTGAGPIHNLEGTW